MSKTTLPAGNAKKDSQVQTFTPHPPDGEYLRVSPDEIFVGNINPRKTFNEEKLAELTESVRAKGVLEPLLVRPRQQTKGKGRFELVAGERRWRAATRAKVNTVPVISYPYTDQEALEIAVVENEQREDVALLEKAEGYMRLMKEFNFSAEALAARINKSEAHVHATVKLLALPEIARNALNEGHISKSHAELIARVPNAEGRERLAKRILYGHENQRVNVKQPKLDVCSVRTAKTFAESFTKELSKAQFDTTDATLNPEMGACTNCPYKSGNNRKDFPDGRADVCNQPACFDIKTQVAQERKLAALQSSKGAELVPADDLKKYMSYGYVSGSSPYLELKDTCYQDKKYRSYRQLVGKELGKSVKLFIAMKERDGSVLEVALKSEVNAVLKRVHNIDIFGRGGSGKEEAARRLKSQARGAAVTKALGIVATFFQRQAAGGFAIKFDKHLRMAAISMLNAIQNDALREVVKRRGIEVKSKYPQFAKELAKVAAKMSGPELFGLMMEAGVCESLHYWKGPYGGDIREHTKEVLKAAGVNLSALETTELKSIKEKRKERESKAKANKAKKAKKAGGKGTQAAARA